jgi:hypothetical protein
MWLLHQKLSREKISLQRQMSAAPAAVICVHTLLMIDKDTLLLRGCCAERLQHSCRRTPQARLFSLLPALLRLLPRLLWQLRCG